MIAIRVTLLATGLMTALVSQAQHVKLIDGSLLPLQSESTIVTSFAYDNMRVGKDNEADYVTSKKDQYNKKEPGKGDSWAKSWVNDRKERYEPKFNELLQKYAEKTVGNKGKYTLVLFWCFTEPGFNAGIARHSAHIDGEAWIVETDHPEKVVAKLSVEKAPGAGIFGSDFDTGERIAEAYASAGKAIGKFIKSN
jgi:hypothetical protein